MVDFSGFSQQWQQNVSMATMVVDQFGYENIPYECHA
jgi:hypothetical protein